MTIGNDIQHSMQRRSFAHDYSRPGLYHITMHVAEGLGQPLGTVVGDDADTAHMVLSTVGAAVERELLTAITAHYPMTMVEAYVVMPEHLHFILNVYDPIISGSGRSTHLGQVIAGFKQGCNRAYWAVTGQDEPLAAKPQGSVTGAAVATSVAGGSAARKARFTSGRPPLFAPGYCDVMPVERGQLDTVRAYIADNPRSRWLRSHDRQRLQPRRGTIDTLVTPAALHGYLRRECPPHLLTADVWGQIVGRLMVAGGKIVCDSYGDLSLLRRRLLPVVCHRKDKHRFEQQKARSLQAAAEGAVLVSPRIAKGEQDIMDAAVSAGWAVIVVSDNGFPTVYHPSEERLARCADRRLLIVSPWQYQYRGKNEQVSVPFCKAMNCMAQAISRKKDDWWKVSEENR